MLIDPEDQPCSHQSNLFATVARAMSSEPLPPFNHNRKWAVTEPPDLNFQWGQKVDATDEGRAWLRGLESGFETVDTAKTETAALYKILVSGIIPRPIGFVSSISDDGIENLALFSFFNMVSHDPPVLSFASSNYPTRNKDTVQNIRATKEFTVNIISEPFLRNAIATSIDAPPEVSEWPLSGLTKEPSLHVKAPRVRESAFSMECELFKTVDIVEPNSLKAKSTLVLGLIKYIHMRKDTLDPARGIPDPGKLKVAVRLGSPNYATLGDVFQLPIPQWEKEKDEIKEIMGEGYVNGKGQNE